MPRVKMAGSKYLDQDLSQLIRRYKYGMAWTNAQAARKIGVSEGTWKNYLQDPGRIPLDKLRKIQKELRIPKEEIFRVLI